MELSQEEIRGRRRLAGELTALIRSESEKIKNDPGHTLYDAGQFNALAIVMEYLNENLDGVRQ